MTLSSNYTGRYKKKIINSIGFRYGINITLGQDRKTKAYQNMISKNSSLYLGIIYVSVKWCWEKDWGILLCYISSLENNQYRVLSHVYFKSNQDRHKV